MKEEAKIASLTNPSFLLEVRAQEPSATKSTRSFFSMDIVAEVAAEMPHF
jgi:hypothetical protein